MLDRNKYIKMEESEIKCGQTSSGVWYCKELPAKNPTELEIKISRVNEILNTYNKKEKEQEDSSQKKSKGKK